MHINANILYYKGLIISLILVIIKGKYIKINLSNNTISFK